VCLKDIRLPDDFEPANESEETWEGICPISGDMIPCDETILMAWYTSLFNGD